MSYTMYTPLNVWLDPASVTDVVAYIQTYLSENTIYSDTEIETIIHDYLIAHPELIGGVQSVNGKTGAVVLSASDINTANNVTIESVLSSLSSQISSIAASVATNTSNITSLTGRVTTEETDISNLKSALQTYPDYNWAVGKEIRNTDGIPVDNAYYACSDAVYFTKHSRIVNNTPQRDSAGKALVTTVALYNGGLFIRKDSIPYNSTYTVTDDITSIRLSIGRYTSSGVTFTDSDIGLFEFDLFVNPSVEAVDKYKSLPERKVSKFRYIWHDNFHRANSSNLGTNGDTLHPMTYEYAGAQLKVDNDMCVNTAASKGQAFADMHVSDCILEFEADLSSTELTTRGAGVMFRRTDAQNFLSCQLRRENLRISKTVSGATTDLKIIQITSPTKAPIKVSVTLNGDKITLMTNGVEVATVYDDFNKTATAHGIYIDGMSSGNNPIIKNFGVKIPTQWQPMVDQMDGGELPYNIKTENAGQSYNFANQTAVVCNSERALRFENRRTDNNKRSEISITNYGSMLDEQFIEWDMRLGSDYSVIDPTSEIIMQMHDLPDDGASIGTQPSFSLYIRDGHYFVHTQYSPYKATYDTSHITSINAQIGDYLEDVETWVHWTLHIKWAYNKFFEPFIYLYKNGELVYESHLPNVINAAAVPYAKFGIYTFNWIEQPDTAVATVRTMYVDNIKPSY